MKKAVKNSLIIGTVTSLAVVILVPSIISIAAAKASANYDLGLAVETMTTLNYLKYSNIGSSIQSLVEGIMKVGPEKEIKEALGLAQIDYSIINLPGNQPLNSLTPGQKRFMRESGRFYPLSDNGITTGVLAGKTGEDSKLLAIMNSNSNRVVGTKATLNGGQSLWSNRDPVMAQDFIDALQYILDFNTGSQLVNEVINFRIKNTEKIIAAQEEYIKKFRVAYQNPFGRANFIWSKEKNDYIENPKFKPWESQVKGDEAEVAAIKEAVLGFGVFTGQAFVGYTNEFVSQRAKLSEGYVVETNEEIEIENPKFNLNLTEAQQPGIPKTLKVKLERNRFFDWKRQNFDPTLSELGEYFAFAQNEYDIFYEFEETTPESIFSIITNMYRRSGMLPANRKFIETVAGGIENFGSTLAKFTWNGPFDVEDLSLGTNGYMILKKRLDYYSHEKTLPQRIKIYFQRDANVTMAMFEQGYIAESDLPTISQLKSWSDPNLKPLMEKRSGYGTIGLQLNLDKTIAKARNSFLDDVDLRVAIAFAIDREQVLKLAGWDSSFPVVTWTAFGESVTTSGVPLESFFDDEFFTSKYPVNGVAKRFPIQNYTHHDHQAKRFTFEHVDRKDTGFSLPTAKAYLDAFKAKHPELQKVTLEYVSNSTIEQINAGLALKDLMNKAFGGFIDISLKDLPANVYDEMKSRGQFDIAYGNFDHFGSSAESYVKIYFFPDGINLAEGKQTGYRLNTAGNWTYADYFTDIVGANDQQYYERLEITPKNWNKIKELSMRLSSENETTYKDRVNSFFTSTFTAAELAENWNETGVFEIITALEKIIRDSAPVIPLMEVDTKWSISRLGGIESASPLSLQFAYDINKPPRPTLPRRRK